MADVPAVALLAGSLALHQPASAGAESPKIQASARLYDTYCAQCHGVQRNGKGINTVGLSVQPRDHSDTVAMASLPRDQAESIMLRTVLGFDAVTAAQILGKTPGAVRAASFRGLRQLAKKIDQDP